MVIKLINKIDLIFVYNTNSKYLFLIKKKTSEQLFLNEELIIFFSLFQGPLFIVIVYESPWIIIFYMLIDLSNIKHSSVVLGQSVDL